MSETTSDCGSCNALMSHLSKANCDLQWCLIRLNQERTRNLHLSSYVAFLETTLAESQATLQCAMTLLHQTSNTQINVQLRETSLAQSSHSDEVVRTD